MSRKMKDCRRQYIVNPSFQRRLIRDVSIMPIFALIIGTVLVVVNFLIMLQMAKTTEVEFPGIYGLLVSLIGLVFVSSCYVTLNTAIRLSNRIAGPLHRLHKAMEQVLKGDTQCRISFRKDDYLHDTAEVFNRILTYIETQKHISSNAENTTAPAYEESDRAEVNTAESKM